VPSSVPGFKKAFRAWARARLDAAAMTGVKVYARGVTPDILGNGDEAVLLGAVTTARQTVATLSGLKEEAPSMTCYVNIVKGGDSEDVGDAARDRAYAILGVLEDALQDDPTVGGFLTGAGAANVTETGLDDIPVDVNGTAGQHAKLRVVVGWTADLA
jgi:hypothetical protein